MSLYSIPFYGQPIFYGTDEFGGVPGGPVGLNAYQNVDGSVILYWHMDPCSVSLTSFSWTVETDLVATFDSVNLRSYSSVANPNFISGCVNKGIVVNAYPRQQGVVAPMYWRVRGTLGGADTSWSENVFDTPMAVNDIVRQSMLDTLPDVIYKKDFAAGTNQLKAIVFNGPLITGNVYNLTVGGVALTPTAFSATNDNTLSVIASKIAAVPGISSATVVSAGVSADDDREILIRASEKDTPISLSGSIVTGGVAQATTSFVIRNTTNVNRIFDAYGKEMDTLFIETVLTNNDLFTAVVRDQSLRDNFSILLDIQQPATMKTIDFREIVRSMLKEAGNTPSYGAVKRVLASMFCADPTFILIRDTMGMYVDDPSSSPAVLPFYVDDALSLPPVLPETIWDNSHLGYGVVIQINNPIGCSIPPSFVESVISKLVPVHAPVYITGI